jgi:antitoxin ParD1/3/4
MRRQAKGRAMCGDDEEIDPEYVIPDEVLRRKIQEAYDDPRPDIPGEEVFRRLWQHHAERMKARNADRPSR